MKAIIKTIRNVFSTLTVLLLAVSSSDGQVAMVKDTMVVNKTTTTMFDEIKQIAENSGDNSFIFIALGVVLFVVSIAVSVNRTVAN